MKCGEFRSKASHRVTIQNRSEAGDAYGGRATTWATLSTVWAVINPTSGREPLSNAQLQSRVTHKITIRYIASLKDTATAAKKRVSYDGRLFSVKFIKNLDVDMKNEGKAYQVLMCEENDAEN